MRIALFLIVLTGVIVAWGFWTNIRRPELGIVSGALLPCSSLPNCVSSDATDESHFIAPLPAKKEALKKIAAILKNDPNVTIVEESAEYLHAEASSPVFGFKDDLEFYYPPGAPVIHLRSSARVGYYDLGVNRARLEKIREDYLAN